MFDTLILAPHIDDEVLGCFSFLTSQTKVLWFGVEPYHGVTRVERIKEAEAVAHSVGFVFELLEHPVNRYEPAALIGTIEEQLSQHPIKTLLLPRPSYNQDHRAVYEAGFTASRHHDQRPLVPRVLVYDQVHASIWPRDAFHANYFRPIDLDKKLALWRLHRSQQRAHRSHKHIETLASFRGQQAGVDYAEAYSVLRWVAS